MKVLLFIFFLVKCFPHSHAVEKIQEFFIAAVETSWDYLNTGGVDPAANQRGSSIQKYAKAVYTEFTDSTFTTPKTKPPWAGIQGPTIRAEVNDRVVVHFKNFATYPLSISPIGIPYWKQSEGAGYDDSTSVQEQEDDAVQPGGYYKYMWDIHPNSGPTITDPECLTYSYSSQVDIVRDFNSGLIGAFLICKSGALTEDRQRKVPEFVLLLAVFDESKSWYRDVGRADKLRKSSARQQFHTINGYINSTLKGLKLCQKSPEVSWHLIGLGSTQDIHTIQFQDHTLIVMDHRRVMVEITPMTFTTALLKPYAEGKFLISCRIHSHEQAGMSAFFSVENCPESNELPEKLNVQHTYEEEERDEDYPMDNLFSIVLRPGGPPSVLRSGGRRPKVWIHYISAEEVMWDYNPEGDRLSKFKPSVQQTQRLGKVYKKVAYVEYTDHTFTKKRSQSNALIGPELRGEVNDQFQIVFKNMANRPYNIFPNGLVSVQPMKKTEKQVDLRSLAVPPGEIMMYLWKVTPEDSPTEADPRCLTRLYHSTVDPERDMASGLVGPLIICKSESLDKRGKVLSSDREKHLMFSIFDENKSWYADENIRKFSEDHSKIDRNDPHFYNSNVMHSVNGFMYNSLQFRMCVGDVMLWHVASVGMQSDFLSVYFMGNPFERDRTYGTVLTLFPMTGDTVITEMETKGEWEIGAFDPTLKAKGMSVRYSVFNCEPELTLVDTDDYDDLNDHIDKHFPIPRGFRKRNRTVAIEVCQKVSSNTSQTEQQNATKMPLEKKGEKTTLVCKRKLVPVDDAEDLDVLSQGGIPQDILDQLNMEMSSSKRQKRLAFVKNDTEAKSDHPPSHSHRTNTESASQRNAKVDGVVKMEDNETVRYQDVDKPEKSNLNKSASVDLFKKFIQKSGLNTTSKLDLKANLTERTRREIWEKNIGEATNTNDGMSDNDVLKALDKLMKSPDPQIYDYKDVHHLNLSSQYSPSNSSQNETYLKNLPPLEYDDYEDEGNKTVLSFSSTDEMDIRSSETKFRSYYIAAEEIMWDYGIDKPSQLISARETKKGMRKYFPAYKKVVYRAYHDRDFKNPVKRGELDEHLGIMGPVLKVEVNDVLTVVFRNTAFRPYSLHLHGVYDRTTVSSAPQGVELREDEGPGDPVPPGEERIYNWRITKRQGPSSKDFDCKAGAYYSTVNMEKDINSGLIGPLLICRPGTLKSRVLLQPGVQDLFLLFTVFDEKKSWYLDYNIRKFCTSPCQAKVDDPWFETNNKFAAINGYVADTLPGLVVPQHQISRWHLLNVGSGGEFHAVHFHGIPFSVGKDQEHRLGIFNLYPGVFGSIEMRPGIAGTWLVECTIGDHQHAGMRAKLLVYNPQCIQPLGMQSGWIADEQLTESDHYDKWEAGLARLHLSGSVNAWIGNNENSWIQVDLLRPMVVHGIQTQGAKTSFGLKELFTVIFNISYSLNLKTWKTYKGNSSESVYKFNGNLDGSRVKENLFSPPIIGRYIRIHPSTYVTKPTLRFELLGCDLNSCSLPLGMQRRLIPDNQISASTFRQSWRNSWSPGLARLNQDGSANAWRPKTNNPYEWLQVDFKVVKRVTGIVTQGARSMLTSMMVTEFSISVSDDGHSWAMVTEPGMQQEKIFEGNSEHDAEKLNVFESPLFTRFIRIHPKGWVNDIALRVEFLGCDTQQRL
ncbi:coagulation factor VIII [Ictalurus furcatus]|uniref:coagulation factor VIII n=1 Tax=Ictalurus furcatus TaxID=66913 RepID=UPI0023500413|nr:coagulation factor VIII [Ictalurus furcatus]